MDRRVFFLMGYALLAASRPASSQTPGFQILIPTVEEFVSTLQDETQFRGMISGVWLLREILLLPTAQQEIPPEARDELLGLTKIVEGSRDTAANAALNDKNSIELASPVLQSAEKIAANLQEIGVQSGSLLFNRLIQSYLKFNQVLVTQSSNNSLCSVYPFRIWCSS